MGEKKAPRLTPEQNEVRQAARAAKREKAKDERHVALLAVLLYTGNIQERVSTARLVLAAARKYD